MKITLRVHFIKTTVKRQKSDPDFGQFLLAYTVLEINCFSYVNDLAPSFWVIWNWHPVGIDALNLLEQVQAMSSSFQTLQCNRNLRWGPTTTWGRTANTQNWIPPAKWRYTNVGILKNLSLIFSCLLSKLRRLGVMIPIRTSDSNLDWSLFQHPRPKIKTNAENICR